MTIQQRPVVHLFIGLHKTGSTALRFMLDVHRESFARFGFHVPRATWTQTINGFFNGGHNNIAWEVCGNRPTVAEFGTVADLAREIASLPERQHILLTEALDVAQPAHIARLKEALAGCDVRPVVFLRNQVDWLQAIFAEEQKWFTATTFDRWFQSHLGDERLDFVRLCGKWRGAFGHVTIRCYEDIRGRILDAFLEACDAPDGLRRALGQRAMPIVNVTPGAFPLELIRHAAAFTTKLGIDPWMFNTMMSPSSLASSMQIDRFSKKPDVITEEVGEALFPLMRTTNAALAAEFELLLGQKYLDPVVPPAAPAASTDVSIEELAKVLVTVVAGMSLRTVGAVRSIGITHGDGLDPAVADTLRSIAARHYPWAGVALPESTLLDDLVAASLRDGGTALYLERRDDVRTAYRRVNGEMVPITTLSADHWQVLLLHLQIRAGLGPVLGRALRQGHIEIPGHARAPWVWMRHAMTSDGELAILEPVARS